MTNLEYKTAKIVTEDDVNLSSMMTEEKRYQYWKRLYFMTFSIFIIMNMLPAIFFKVLFNESPNLSKTIVRISF